MCEAGLTQIHVDAIGNLIGRREATGRIGAPALVLGSHLDTVPDAGRYDGILGVLLGVAAAESLRETPLPFALEVVGFSEEEGVRFGVPYLGSRAFAGTLSPSHLERRDANGRCIADAVAAFGLDPTDLPDGPYRPADMLRGYIEVHIEQGPALEHAGAPLGVVTAIAGQSRLQLRFGGRPGHAGTTPMVRRALRRDALAGASEYVLAVEAMAEETPGAVATVGQMAVIPGVGNVIPGQTDLSLDLRHADDTTRRTLLDALLHAAYQIAERRGLEFHILSETHQDAVPMDAGLSDRLVETVATITMAACPTLVSGAGHDAAILAPHVPTALLFVRSPNGGLSHHPDEAVHADDVATALRALIAIILRLAAECASAGTEKDST